MKARTRWTVWTTACAAVLAGAGSASGQVRPPTDIRTPPLTVSLTPRGEYTFESDLKDTPGSVSIARAGMGLSLTAPLNEKFRLLLNGDVEASWYDFKDSINITPGVNDPADDLYRVQLSPGFSYAIDDRWALLAAGIFEFAGEGGVDISDGMTYGGYLGARYKFNDNFALTFGGGAKTRLEENADFIPLIGFEWTIKQKLRLASDGLGLKLTADVAEQWAVSIGARYEQREYRLDDDAPVSEGILRDKRVPVRAGIEWSPSKTVSVELAGGLVAWQEYRFDDSEGAEIREVNTDPAGFVALQARIRF